MYSPTANMVGVDHGSLEHHALAADNTHTQVWPRLCLSLIQAAHPSWETLASTENRTLTWMLCDELLTKPGRTDRYIESGLSKVSAVLCIHGADSEDSECAWMSVECPSTFSYRLSSGWANRYCSGYLCSEMSLQFVQTQFSRVRALLPNSLPCLGQLWPEKVKFDKCLLVTWMQVDEEERED